MRPGASAIRQVRPQSDVYIESGGIVRLIATGLLASLLAGCARDPVDQLYGHWKSYEAGTLTELEAAKEAGRLTEWSEEREAFLRAGFFGRLEILIEPGRSKAWFPEENPDDVSWDEHSLNYLGESTFLSISKSAATGETYPRQLKLQADGKCYVVEQDSVGFSEWFCRVGSR